MNPAFSDGSHPVVCAQCGARAYLADDRTSAGSLIFLAGGLLPYLIFAANRQRVVRCPRCECPIRAQLPKNPADKYGYLLFAFMFAPAVLALLLSWLVMNFCGPAH